MHNARQLINSLEEELPWSVRLDIMIYLHEKQIVHCDVKAGNIFIGGDSESRYLAKIGDFGQAVFEFGQFSLTQNTSYPESQTRKENECNRVGTVAYAAPELMDIGAKRNVQSDVYSFAMVMVEFSLPERSHPWEGEITTCALIYHHIKKGERPSVDPEKLRDFPDNKQDEWLSLIKQCWSQRMESGPPMKTVSELLSSMSTTGQKFSSTENIGATSADYTGALIGIEDVCLDVHQGTVVETAGNVASFVYGNNEEIGHLQQDLSDCIDKLDGTNACPFLAIKNSDILYSEPLVVSNKESLKRKVEEIIHDLPRQINDSRDATQLSYVDEAVEVLKSKGLLARRYDLNELITDQLPANDVQKTTLPKKAVLNLAEQNPSVAVYTCTPICNTIGFVNDMFIIVDTHRISTELGGSGNALIKLVHCKATSESRSAGENAVVDWLEQRMTSVVREKRGSES